MTTTLNHEEQQIDLISSPISPDSALNSSEIIDSNNSMSLAVKNGIQQALLDASALDEDNSDMDAMTEKKKKKRKKKKRKKKKKKRKTDETEDSEYIDE